jgi:hypothetical protein
LRKKRRRKKKPKENQKERLAEEAPTYLTYA